MNFEVGKKYIIKFDSEDREWVASCVDKWGCGWGLIDGSMMCFSERYPNIREWTPDPGEGYDLFMYGQPNFEVVQKGDQFWSNEGWHDSHRVNCEPNKERFYRRPKAKKLVPFTWEDRDFLRGKVIVSQDKTMKMELSNFWEFRGDFMVNHDGATGLLKDGWTFEDGTPCGKYA